MIVLYDQAWMSTNSMFSLFSSWQWNNTSELWLMPISAFPLHPPSISFLSLHPSLSPELSHSLCSPALYHSVCVTVTMHAFGAPRRHSHVAAADMRMWPWLAAPRRATREHFKGCLTAGWGILCSPEAQAPLPSDTSFTCTHHIHKCVTIQAWNVMACEGSARCNEKNILTRRHNWFSALWSWPHVEKNSVSHHSEMGT